MGIAGTGGRGQFRNNPRNQDEQNLYVHIRLTSESVPGAFTPGTLIAFG